MIEQIIIRKLSPMSLNDEKYNDNCKMMFLASHYSNNTKRTKMCTKIEKISYNISETKDVLEERKIIKGILGERKSRKGIPREQKSHIVQVLQDKKDKSISFELKSAK